MTNFTESVIEEAALTWLKSLGYTIEHGPEFAPGEFLVEWAATVAKNATVEQDKLRPWNCFREGNSWTLSCDRG
jgi:hypothetical protein